MWTAYLYQSISGAIGPELNYESMSWSIELNGTESISLKLRKSDLPKVDLTYWLASWWSGVVLLWNGTPIVAGPITARPSESTDTVSVKCGGIRSILANRVVVNEQTNWALLPKTTVAYKNLALGSIAQYVVQVSQLKPSGSLPISYPLPIESGTHERNYRGFDLQNLTCDGVLTKLSNVIDGPDIMFKPRLIKDNQLTFDMWHGTNADPRIQQRTIPFWDTTAQMGQAVDMTVTYTGSYQTSRVFSTGAGSDEGMLVAVQSNSAPLQHQFPLLEKVINIGNSEDPAVVNGYASAYLATHADALLEIQMTVRGDGIYPFGSFWPGDLVRVLTKGWLSLPDGTTDMRLLSMTGDHTGNVKISLQKDSKFT